MEASLQADFIAAGGEVQGYEVAQWIKTPKPALATRVPEATR